MDLRLLIRTSIRERMSECDRDRLQMKQKRAHFCPFTHFRAHEKMALFGALRVVFSAVGRRRGRSGGISIRQLRIRRTVT